MLVQAADAKRGSSHPTTAVVKIPSGQSLLLTENQQSIGGPPSLMEKLTLREREIVLKQGRRKVLNRGQTLFNQGAKAVHSIRFFQRPPQRPQLSFRKCNISQPYTAPHTNLPIHGSNAILDHVDCTSHNRRLRKPAQVHRCRFG